MSSGRQGGCGDRWWGISEEVAVDDVGKPAFEGSKGFGASVAAGKSAFEEPARIRMATALGDRDAMEGAIQLPVPGAGEPVALPVPDDTGNGAVPV